MLERSKAGSPWKPKVLSTRADRDEGIEELAAALDDHTEYLRESGELKARRAIRDDRELLALLGEHVAERWEALKHRPALAALAARVISRDVGASALLRALADGREAAEACCCRPAVRSS
jgi:LAO/AO transport system kinase